MTSRRPDVLVACLHLRVIPACVLHTYWMMLRSFLALCGSHGPDCVAALLVAEQNVRLIVLSSWGVLFS
jgi:hypothetical protein